MGAFLFCGVTLDWLYVCIVLIISVIGCGNVSTKKMCILTLVWIMMMY